MLRVILDPAGCNPRDDLAYVSKRLSRDLRALEVISARYQRAIPPITANQPLQWGKSRSQPTLHPGSWSLPPLLMRVFALGWDIRKVRAVPRERRRQLVSRLAADADRGLGPRNQEGPWKAARPYDTGLPLALA